MTLVSYLSPYGVRIIRKTSTFELTFVVILSHDGRKAVLPARFPRTSVAWRPRFALSEMPFSDRFINFRLFNFIVKRVSWLHSYSRSSSRQALSSRFQSGQPCLDVSTNINPPGPTSPVTMGVIIPVVRSIVPTNGPPSAAV